MVFVCAYIKFIIISFCAFSQNVANFWCPVVGQVRTNIQTYREYNVSFLVPCTLVPF